MKVERLYDGYYIDCIEVRCSSCKHTIYFKYDMLSYCTGFYCHYCGNRINIKEFLIKKKINCL